MPALTSEHKRLIVQRLATFVQPAEIITELKGLGVRVTFSHIAYYNPALRSDLAEEWKALHAATRKAFMRETVDIAIANKSYRLQRLDEMSRDAEARGNFKIAAELIKQAAKEMGEAYTNHRTVAPGRVQKPRNVTEPALSGASLAQLLTGR